MQSPLAALEARIAHLESRPAGTDAVLTAPDNRLTGAIKQTLRNLHALGATTAKATVIEDGLQHTIDLIADRVSSRQRTETDGRPPAETMYGLIDNAREECSEAIDGYFGAVDNALA